jgi:hypothetical protein
VCWGGRDNQGKSDEGVGGKGGVKREVSGCLSPSAIAVVREARALSSKPRLEGAGELGQLLASGAHANRLAVLKQQKERAGQQKIVRERDGGR